MVFRNHEKPTTHHHRPHILHVVPLPQNVSHIPQLASPLGSVEGPAQQHRRARGAVAGHVRVAPGQLMLDQETKEKHHQGQGLTLPSGSPEKRWNKIHEMFHGVNQPFLTKNCHF